MAITKTLTKGKKKCKVTFSLPAQAAPSAKVVKVVGDFNNWSWNKGVKLSKSSDEFTGQLELDPGQRYEFRYCIDNKEWDNDWMADEYAPSPFGVENSVVITPTGSATATASPSRAASQAPNTTKKNNSSKTTLTTTTRTTKGKGKIDFTVIEGVGPKICSLLEAAGYNDFQSLSTAKVGDLRQILKDAGSRYTIHDPKNWAKQAKLAASDQWTKLNAFQAELKNKK